MNAAEARDWVVARARALGFDLCGVAPAADFDELAHLPEWLARGYAGEMRYLDDPRRQSPQAALPGARSLIVCALNYNTPFPYSTDARTANVAPPSCPEPAAGGRRVRAAPARVPDEPAGLEPAATSHSTLDSSGHGFSRANEDRRAVPAALPKADAEAARPQHHSPPRARAEPAASEQRGWISRYAWGDDYHHVLGAKLDALLTAMNARFADAPFDARAYVDTGPVHERIAAHHAGLGWLGKNTCLINDRLGSWLFLGVILTTLDLAPSIPGGVNGPAPSASATPFDHPITRSPNHSISLPPDLCGQCTQCLDACPTGALVAPYVLDARRCISYLTIELRGPIPAEFHDALGWHVFGCDICQDVCPFNRKAPTTDALEFQPRPLPFNHPITQSADHPISNSLFTPSLEELAALSEEEFRQLFRGSAIKRTKHAGLSRNVKVALKNT
jgi:epoxyqueuosine reductase